MLFSAFFAISAVKQTCVRFTMLHPCSSKLRVDFFEVAFVDEHFARLAASGGDTRPSISIMSTSRAARLNPIRSRRCRYEIDAWPL